MRLYPVGRYVIALNDDHKLPDIHREHPFYDRTHMLVAAEVLRTVEGIVIDIGANVGDTAAAFATVSDRTIMAFEGSDEYFPYLEHNAGIIGPQLVINKAFVETDAFPVSDYVFVAEYGTGKFQAGGEGQHKTNSISLAEVVNAAVQAGGVGVFKTDTDGYDLAILSEFIKDNDAVLFFEYDVILTLGQAKFERWQDFFNILENRGYSAILFDNFGLPIMTCEQGIAASAADLHRYCLTQRAIRSNRMYYNDVWAFPPSQREAYQAVVEMLRRLVFLNDRA